VSGRQACPRAPPPLSLPIPRLFVQCLCGYKFCFMCGEEAHAPVKVSPPNHGPPVRALAQCDKSPKARRIRTHWRALRLHSHPATPPLPLPWPPPSPLAQCERLRAWRQKEQGESENSQWLYAHTKPCPTCQSPIQKNDGCNHMTCSKCRGEFCWICLGPWASHGTSWSAHRPPLPHQPPSPTPRHSEGVGVWGTLPSVCVCLCVWLCLCACVCVCVCLCVCVGV